MGAVYEFRPEATCKRERLEIDGLPLYRSASVSHSRATFVTAGGVAARMGRYLLQW